MARSVHRTEVFSGRLCHIGKIEQGLILFAPLARSARSILSCSVKSASFIPNSASRFANFSLYAIPSVHLNCRNLTAIFSDYRSGDEGLRFANFTSHGKSLF